MRRQGCSHLSLIRLTARRAPVLPGLQLAACSLQNIGPGGGSSHALVDLGRCFISTRLVVGRPRQPRLAACDVTLRLQLLSRRTCRSGARASRGGVGPTTSSVPPPESLSGNKKKSSDWDWGLSGLLKGFLGNFRVAPPCVSSRKPWRLGRPFAGTCARGLADHLCVTRHRVLEGVDLMRASLSLACDVQH